MTSLLGLAAVEESSTPIGRSVEVGSVAEARSARVWLAMAGLARAGSKIAIGSMVLGIVRGASVGVSMCSPSGSSFRSKKLSSIPGK